jgi:ribosomal protein S18 acetylase RimI-like enzyme
MKIRTAVDTDYPEIINIAAQEPFIARHTTYTYWLLHEMDPEAIIVAESEGKVTAFVAGIFGFQRPDQSMLVQIAVSQAVRHTGLGRRLVEAFMERSLARGQNRMILTISSENPVSEKFFTAVASDRHTTLRPLGTTGTLGGALDEENLWEINLMSEASTR